MEWDSAIEDPSVHSVVTAQPILHFEYLLLPERGQVDVEASLEIVSMHAGSPPRPRFFLEPAAGEGEPPLVKIIAFGVGLRPPDHDWGLFDHLLVFGKGESSIR